MIKKISTQVLVIGGGPSGYSAAFRSSDLGMNTILLERYNQLGGVCLNVGCIPSKSLLHISKIIRENNYLNSIGIFSKRVNFDISNIRKWKNNIINNLNIGLKNISNYRNIKHIIGTGSFKDSNTVEVINKNKERMEINFENVIIATGSKSINMDNISFQDERIWNSTDALQLKYIPKKLLIIGSGIIGIEMATVYSSLGSKVDIFEHQKEIFPYLDKDIINIFTNSNKDYFNFYLNTNVIKIKKEKNIFSVYSICNNKEKLSQYDAILIAVGRKPEIDNLNLSNVNVQINDFGYIEVDNQLRTNVSNIYAIGDVIGSPMLAHKGLYQGKLVSEIIFGHKHYYNPISIPCVAYTDPEIAWVGVISDNVKDKMNSYKSSIFSWNYLGRALASSCESGMTKLFFDKKTNCIVGACIVGVNAGELIGEINLAIEMGCTAEDLSLTIHPHPTLSESIGLASEVFQGTVIDILNK
ncbi:dihydrolipoyl dehydrogenase [Buchnera aphidicola (Kurisakia onigurumii)]|uniref:dihydrolipoyl dehydrogenase n=1 Tax=Buchnera aphidicola TaxID=9 RepID=UPI0031B6A70D